MHKVLGSIRKVRFTHSTPRQGSIPEKKGPSPGNIQVKIPHQRSSYAVNFEDQSHEETGRQQRCARSKAWNFAKNIFKLRENDKATFYLPVEEWVLPAASSMKSVEREFAVDSGASMHMVSEKDLNSLELETMRTSRSPTTVKTANGEVQTREEVKELDLFVTAVLPEETRADLSLGKLCEERGYTYHWTSGQKLYLIRKPQLTKNCKRMNCIISNHVPFVVPGLSTSSYTTPILLHHLHLRNPYLTQADTPKIQYPREVEELVESFGETRCINPQKPKTKLKMKDAKKYKAIYCMTCWTGCRNSEKFRSMKAVLQSHGETLRPSFETLPVLLMNYQWSREQKYYWVRVT